MRKLAAKCLTAALVFAGFTASGPSAEAGYIYTGGSFSGNYDNRGFYLDVSPLIGYRIGIYDFGVSPFYSYSERDDISSYTYGSRLFTQATFYRDIYAHAELQLTNMEKPGTDDDRKWAASFPVGAGYRRRLDRRTTAYAMVLYDLAMDDDSPAHNPLFRTGINYRF